MLLVLEPDSVWGVCQMTSPLWMLILCCSLHIQSALSELAFSLQPEDGIGVLGAPLSIPCAVYDSHQQRALSVKWERVGGDAATAVTVVQDPGAAPGVIYQLANGSLVFPRLRERHLGRYVCSANTGRDFISTVVQVEKAGMEPVFFSPKSQRVSEGEGVFLQCVSGDSSPPAHITWLKDRRALDVTRGTQIQGQYGGGNQMKTTGTLHLPNVTLEDEGAYVCVTHNPLLNTSMESSSAMLTVLGVPRRLQITQGPKNITVALATKASMSCTVRGFPVPMVQWFKEDRLLTNGSGLSLLNNGQLLVWRNVSDDDEGLYYCEATNQRERLKSPPAYLLPAVMGWSFVEQPNNQTLKRGDSVTLVCRPPYSRPRAHVTWFRNNHVLSPKSHLTVRSSGDLHFFSVQESDNGVYFCRASSSHLHRSVTSRRVSLNVLAPPSVRLWPQVVTVTIGAQVRLLCQVSGNPLPTIRWSKQGRSMQTGGKIIVGMRNATLYILSVRIYDEGLYTCEASNTMGSKHSTAMLRVAVSPIIVSSMGQVSSQVGSSVTLPCRALGVPPITYNWSRSSGHIQTPITSKQDADIDGDGALRISSVQWSDAGEYHCTAENKVGRQQRRSTLTVTADDDQSDSDEQARQNLSAVSSPATEWRASQPSMSRDDGASRKTHGPHVSPHYRDTTGLVPHSDSTNYTLPLHTSPRETHEMTPNPLPMLPLDPPSFHPTLPSITQIDPPSLQPPYIYLSLQHSEPHTQPLLTNETLLPSLTKAAMTNTEAPPTQAELSQFLDPQTYSPVIPFALSEGHSQGQIASLSKQHLELYTMSTGFLTNTASPELYPHTVPSDQQNTLNRPSASQKQGRDLSTETQGFIELIPPTLSQPTSAQPQPPITQAQLTERPTQTFSTYDLLFQLHPLPTLTKGHPQLLNSPSQVHSLHNQPQPFATQGQLPLPKLSPTNTLLFYTRSQASPTPPILSQPQPSLTPHLSQPHPSPTLSRLSKPHPSPTLPHLLQPQQSPTPPYVLKPQQPPAPPNLSQPQQSLTAPDVTQSPTPPNFVQPQQSSTSPHFIQPQPSPTPSHLSPTHNHLPNTSPLQSTTAVTNRSNLSPGFFTLAPFGPGVPKTTSSSSFHQNTSLLANKANPGQSANNTEPLESLKRNTSQSPMTSNDPRVTPRLPSWLPVLEKHDVPIVVGVGVSLAFIFLTMAFYSLVQKNEPVPTCRGAQRNHGVPLRHAEHVAAGRTYENRAYEDDEMVAVIEQSPNTSDTRARPPLAPSLVTVQVEPASEELQGDPQPSLEEDHQSVTVETYPEPSHHTPMECSLEENACCQSQPSIQLQCVEDWGSLVADDHGSCQDVLPPFPLPSPPPVQGEGLRSSLTLQTAESFSTPVHHNLSISHGNSPLILSHCISLGLTSVAVDVHFYPAATAASSTRVNSTTTYSSAAPSYTSGPQLSSTLAYSHEADLSPASTRHNK